MSRAIAPARALAFATIRQTFEEDAFTERAFRAVGHEIRDARAAGRTPPACPPERIDLNPRQLLAYLNGIPQTRRQRMTVTDGIRAWLTSRYPCSG